MLGNLRAKCASLVSLPPDWLHRSRPPRNEITKLSGTVSASHSGEDEWAFAESLMDMINSFSGTGDDLNAHPILIKDSSLDIPIDSRGRDDVSDTRTIVLANNDAGDSLNGSLTLHPSLIIP
ncbi:hypothetical protein AGABI2DRAFT_193207, partial [Agaricus bisporus var. bisporus H97]|uniref:hypothetical protein n=1 Tax=Agaricus bisporus var. bisporus (strain H97 / ATCC MYA-4626 / FGSC 10389) TaxID=936046 RepID=UPI00029F7509